MNLTLETIRAATQKLEHDLAGIPARNLPLVIESPYLGKWKQYRFPRSKRRRIQKKWRNNRRNYRWIESREIYQTPDAIICAPNIAREIRRQIEALLGRRAPLPQDEPR